MTTTTTTARSIEGYERVDNVRVVGRVGMRGFRAQLDIAEILGTGTVRWNELRSGFAMVWFVSME